MMIPVFVFGSNESGHHGGGAARTAKEEEGAIDGVGFGPQGTSFAIPTKSWHIQGTLPLETIKHYVDAFKRYAALHPKQSFKVTRLGCGLAGLKDEDIAPMFVDAPKNCWFDDKWLPWLPGKKTWGTF